MKGATAEERAQALQASKLYNGLPAEERDTFVKALLGNKKSKNFAFIKEYK